MGLRKILIVDSFEGNQTGTQIRTVLQKENEWRVELHTDAPSGGSATLHPLPDLLIPVLPLSGGRMELVTTLLQASGPIPLLLPVLRAESMERELNGLSRWVQDFLVPPPQAAEVLARVRRLLATAKAARGDQEDGRAPLDELIGEHPAILAVKRKIPLLARAEAPVLLSGETGTGKEMCARALHDASRRAGKPFLPVDCGAIPVDLFERELFGNEKGAFTGAWTTKAGLIAEAEGGTLFLDEIDALPLGLQAKLLRFLQDHTYRPLGSPRPKQADVWVLTATNANLPAMVQAGTFRQDLFYRLAVMTLTLPPLRERRTDIPLLVASLCVRYADHPGHEPRRLSPAALEAMCRYTWPGNVRELENVIQQALVLTKTPVIEPADLPLALPPAPTGIAVASFRHAKALAIAAFEKTYLADLLQRHRGNVTHAARAAHTERRTLGRLLKRHNLRGL